MSDKLRKACVCASIVSLSLCGLAAGSGLLAIARGPVARELPTDTLPVVEYKSNPAKIQYSGTLFSFEGKTIEKDEVTELIDLPLMSDLYPTYSSLSVACNLEIYKICAAYFSASSGGIVIPAYFPMALANNETSIRADKDITFCSLYPSAVVTPTSAEDIGDFGVRDVVASQEVFSKLANDWWTRDRGPLQMNGEYGVHSDMYNAMLDKSEQELLKGCENIEGYTAYTSKEGIISGTTFVEKSSFEKGDRYNIHDICLRLSSECNYALDLIQGTYELTDSRLAMVMLSMHHGAGSLWLSNFKDKEIGYWNSGNLAYEYATQVASDAVYEQIFDKAKQDLNYARSHSINPDIGISLTDAMGLYESLQEQGLLKDFDYYTHEGEFRKGYILYPIKFLYNYAQLTLLYNGG